MLHIATEQTWPAIHSERLIEKFRAREARVSVIGLGYVGLPLAVAFAEAGFSVVGVDLNHERVASLNTGRGYVPDSTSERLAALLTAGCRCPPAEHGGQRQLDRHYRAYEALSARLPERRRHSCPENPCGSACTREK